VDIDPASISKNVKVDVPIVGEVDQVLKAMIKEFKDEKPMPDAEALAAGGSRSTSGAPWTACVPTATDEVIKPQYVIETLYKSPRARPS
jgi:acetolactate synthase I/II/III large subunit